MAAVATDGSAAPEHQAAPPMSGLARWTPSFPTIALNTLYPFANGSAEDRRGSTDSARKSQDTPKPSTSSRRPILSAIFAAAASTSADEPSPSQNSFSAMFSEPDTNSNDGSNESRAGSLEAGRKRRKKAHKLKTRYSVCHPPPASSTRQKFHRRARSQLQLHQLSENARPQPAFDVIPSANFNVRMIKATAKVFKAKHGLCPHDLVVIRAEKYARLHDDAEDDGTHVVGLICKGKRDREDAGAAAEKARICLPTGQEWEAYPLVNCGYEFFTTDQHGLGLRVRWVLKKSRDGNKKQDRRFNFSTVSPNSRRHPVIANLTKTRLEMYDTYKMPDPAAMTPLSTPKRRRPSPTRESMDDDASGNEQCETDELLREIITLTGIWVTIKEGWSPSLSGGDKENDTAGSGSRRSPSKTNGVSGPHSPQRSVTAASPTPPASPATGALEKRSSVKSMGSSILRQSSLWTRGSRASQASVPEDITAEGGTPEKQPGEAKKTRHTRGDSVSTMLVHRTASNRRKNNHHAATWRPDLLSARQSMSETAPGDLTGRSSIARNAASSEATPTASRRRSLFAEPLTPSAETLSDSGNDPHVPAREAAGTPTPKAPMLASSSQPESESESEGEGAASDHSSGNAIQHNAAEPTSTAPLKSATATAVTAPMGDGQQTKRRTENKRRSGWRGFILCGKHDM